MMSGVDERMRNVEHGADKDAGEKWWIGNADTDPLDSGPSAEIDATCVNCGERVWSPSGVLVHWATSLRACQGRCSDASVTPPGEPA